jgi:hypothetical protein
MAEPDCGRRDGCVCADGWRLPSITRPHWGRLDPPRLRPTPEITEGRSESRRFGAVRWVEMMAVREQVQREVREDAGESHCHPRIEVRIAPAAESEVDRSIEPPLDSVGSIRRLLEIATFDVIGLENSIARARVLISAVLAAAKLLETGELQARIELLEGALKARPDPSSGGGGLLEDA